MGLNDRCLSVAFVIGALFLSFLIGCKASSKTKQIEEAKAYRVMSYNIHHGEGMDGQLDLERIAHVIDKAKADIIALQEVDVNVERSGNKNILYELSELTGLDHYSFGKNIDLAGGQYGNAVLSRFPIIKNKNTHFDSPASEQRGVLQTVIQLSDTTDLLMMATHLDHKSETDRLIYVNGIKNDILTDYETDAVIIAGDFNDTPGSTTYKKMTAFLDDAWVKSGSGKGYTIPVDKPAKRIDYIFHDTSINPLHTWVPPASLASDHRPVVAELELVK